MPLWLHRNYLASILAFLLGCSPATNTSVPKDAEDNSKASSNTLPLTSVDPPRIPDGFVFRPTFDTTLGNISAGTAFVISLPGREDPILLSAIHLLGPAGGLDKAIPATDLPHAVKQLTLAPCFIEQGESLSLAAKAIPLLGASPNQAQPGPGDIIAFRMKPNPSLKPFPLAAEVPKAGTKVWLVASVADGAPPSQRLHAATVTNDNIPGYLIYSFDNPKIGLPGTSGAPVVDSNGHVVAINLSGGRDKDELIGGGNPVGRFRSYLEKTIETRP